MKKTKVKNRGITLIALVITIIILLILAGISIATLTESGLFGRAKEAKEESEKAEAAEEIKIVLDEWKIVKILDDKTFEQFLNSKIESKEIDEYKVLEDKNIEIYRKTYYVLVDDNGDIIEEIQTLGPRPTVDKNTIVATLEDGKEIPESGVNIGTKIIITFTAKITDGTITEVAPGILENGKIIYTTNGTEKEIKFIVTGEVNGIKYSKPISISLEEFYTKNEFKASDIAKAAKTFYGAEVTEYTCESNGVNKWRIFYADTTNIYLIADNYIEYDNVPKGRLGSSVSQNSSYRCYSFDNICNDYDGSSWIFGNTNGKENSLAKKWLSEYYNYTVTNGDKDYLNIKAVAYMLDTSTWKIYAGEKAEYAIGGPTIELLLKSYNQKHNTDYACRMATTGYELYMGNWNNYFNDMLDITDSLYTSSEENGMWIASPSNSATNAKSLIMNTDDSGLVGGDWSSGSYHRISTNSMSIT